MGIKTYRPYTPSRREMTGSDFAEITKAHQRNHCAIAELQVVIIKVKYSKTPRGGAKRQYRL